MTLRQDLEKGSVNGRTSENQLKEKLIISAIHPQSSLNKNLKKKVRQKRDLSVHHVDTHNVNVLVDNVDNQIRQKRDLSVHHVDTHNVDSLVDNVNNQIRQKRDLSVSFVGSRDVAFENDNMKLTGSNTL